MEQLNQITKGIIEAFNTYEIDKGYCVAEKKETREFNVDGGEFSLFRTLFDQGLRMTIFKQGKKGSISTNRLDKQAIKEAIESCIQVAEAAQVDEAWDLAPYTEKKLFTKGAPEPDVHRLFERSRELLEAIQKQHPKIMIEQMIISHQKCQSVYENTRGTVFETIEGKYHVSLMISAKEGDKNTSFFGIEVATDHLDVPFIALGTIKKDLQDVENQLQTLPFKGKFEGTILLPPACLKSLLYSVIGNFVDDGVILEGTSIWKNQQGQQVADSRISLSMKPLDERIVCGESYTSEGFLSENYAIIKEGRLENFKISLYTANKTGYKRAKNTSYAMIVEPGNTPLEAIIKGIKKGIIVGRFSGGQPAANGDFSGVAKNSFLVEEGEIVGAISETMISGNLADLLNNIQAISEEVSADGMSVLPYIAAGGVVISGK